jgi:hypothetical protein
MRIKTFCIKIKAEQKKRMVMFATQDKVKHTKYERLTVPGGQDHDCSSD